MNKRNSCKKLNGEIILMQNELMSKFANLGQSKKATDELGFCYAQQQQQPDALLNLISKSKNIAQNHTKQIQQAKQQIKQNNRKKQSEATFLTGLGLVKQNQTPTQQTHLSNRYQSHANQEEIDADTMLCELIKKSKNDDLQQLRRMIKKTGSDLQGCSKKLNKNKKSILKMADRYTNEMPTLSLKFLNNYREFELRDLDQYNNF